MPIYDPEKDPSAGFNLPAIEWPAELWSTDAKKLVEPIFDNTIDHDNFIRFWANISSVLNEVEKSCKIHARDWLLLGLMLEIDSIRFSMEHDNDEGKATQ
jgi:hypothetical protein